MTDPDPGGIDRAIAAGVCYCCNEPLKAWEKTVLKSACGSCMPLWYTQLCLLDLVDIGKVSEGWACQLLQIDRLLFREMHLVMHEEGKLCPNAPPRVP